MSGSGDGQAPVPWSAWAGGDPLPAAPQHSPRAQHEPWLATAPAPAAPAQPVAAPPPDPVAAAASGRNAASNRTAPRATERTPAPVVVVPPPVSASQPRTTPTRPTPPRARKKGLSRRVLVGVAAACLLAGGGVAAAVAGPGGGDDPGGSAGPAPVTAPTGDTGATAPASTPTPAGQSRPSAPTTPTTSPEDQAVQRLEQLRATSLQSLRLDDRWVAQVASKSIGITDPLQLARNGTHTFYAADILAESEAARAAAGSAPVLVLTSLDFGKRSVAADGQPYWVTVVDAGFADSDGVDAWCAQTYPSLSPAELANACAPRTLSAPHD